MNTVKSGDRVITAVRHETPQLKQRIQLVHVYEYDGFRLRNLVIMTRQEVVAAIRFRNQHFVTAFERFGKWHWGEDVRAFTRNSRDYIRTDANSIEADNLGDLPEF